MRVKRRVLQLRRVRKNNPSLRELLKFFDVKPKEKVVNGYKTGNRSLGLHRCNDTTLWDYYEQVRVNYRNMISKAHPDKGGCAIMAAKINNAWSQCRELFARRKIGV